MAQPISQCFSRHHCWREILLHTVSAGNLHQFLVITSFIFPFSNPWSSWINNVSFPPFMPIKSYYFQNSLDWFLILSFLSVPANHHCCFHRLRYASSSCHHPYFTIAIVFSFISSLSSISSLWNRILLSSIISLATSAWRSSPVNEVIADRACLPWAHLFHSDDDECSSGNQGADLNDNVHKWNEYMLKGGAGYENKWGCVRGTNAHWRKYGRNQISRNVREGWIICEWFR